MRSMFWADHATKTRPFVRLNNSTNSRSSSTSVVTGLSEPRFVPSVTSTSMSGGGLRHHPVDEHGLAPVTAEVASVKDSFPRALYQQHVGVERRVVSQNRRNGERPDCEGFRATVPCLEGPSKRMAGNVRRDRDQLGRARARPDRPIWWKFLHQARVEIAGLGLFHLQRTHPFTTSLPQEVLENGPQAIFYGSLRP